MISHFLAVSQLSDSSKSTPFSFQIGFFQESRIFFVSSGEPNKALIHWRISQTDACDKLDGGSSWSTGRLVLGSQELLRPPLKRLQRHNAMLLSFWSFAQELQKLVWALWILKVPSHQQTWECADSHCKATLFRLEESAHLHFYIFFLVGQSPIAGLRPAGWPVCFTHRVR